MVNRLNELISIEYAAVIQYYQHSFLTQGLYREPLVEMMRKHAKESLSHVERLGEKVVALGGIPTVEPVMIRQSTDVMEMLKQELELERSCVDKYRHAIEEAKDNVPLRVMLEQMVEEEQRQVEELELILSMRQLALESKEVRLKQG